MEHTKGELVKKGELHKAGQVDRIVVGTNKKALFMAITDNTEANARRLIKCWNAFEEGGLVDDLLEACKEVIRQLFHNSPNDAKEDLWAAMVKATQILEQAIAEAEK